jgi:hypothetical protein
LTAAGNAAAVNYSQESLDRQFRVEFQDEAGAPRPVVSGYVYNLKDGLAADRVQLVVESLDAAGNVLGRSTIWVLGGVPAGGRAYFSARVEPAASYRAQVVAYDWIRSGG